MVRCMRVLVTGASGSIGKAFREAYRGYYLLRLTYHSTPVDAADNEEVVRADIADLDSVKKSMKDVDAVVHLAADRRVDAPWQTTLNKNIIRTYNVFEGARIAGLKKIVYASSNHACGFAVLESELVGPDAPVRPDSYYGVSKVFGEALGRYYSDRFDISVICLRIGWAGLGDPAVMFSDARKTIAEPNSYTGEKLIAMWISGRDMAQLIHRSLETDLKFGIFYGASDNVPPIFDLTETKAKLGYKPQDRAQDHQG